MCSFEKAFIPRDPSAEKKTQEQILQEEYEENHQDLKKALSENPDLYNKQKAEWVQDLLEADNAAGELNSMLEDKIEEKWNDESDLNALLEQSIADYREALVDSVTGLEQRQGLFKRLNAKMAEIFDLDGTESTEDLFGKILKEKRDFKDINLSLMLGDVSFLSLANKAGHDVGDSLLKKIARVTNEESAKAFRHGGDELTAIFERDSAGVGEAVKKMESRITNMEGTANLESYGLKPNFDIGAAEFHEAFGITKKLFEGLPTDFQDDDKFELIEPMKELENIWVKLADQKSFIKKGLTRIPLLVEMYKDDRENFNETIGSLRKGGYDITDEEINDMAKETDASDTNNPIVLEYIIKKEQQTINQKSGYDKTKSELILNKALEGFK